MINKKSKIYIAGHTGLVGSSVLKYLKYNNYKNIFLKTSKELDLRIQRHTFKYLNKIKPDAVIICAAKVGGIKANSDFSAEYIYDNLCIQNNLIHGSFKNNVKHLIFLGSSCIYPKFSQQPIKEEYLLKGYLEKTNEAYSIAKIAGIKLVEHYNSQYNLNYKSLMPCNLFGPNDNYNLSNSHFIPAIIKKLYLAKIYNKKEVKFWGNGTAYREVMHVDHLAKAIMFFLNKKTNYSLINIGSGYEKKIFQFIKIIAKILNCNSKIIFDKNKKLDGTPRKLLDTSLATKLGFSVNTNFLQDIGSACNDFITNRDKTLL